MTAFRRLGDDELAVARPVFARAFGRDIGVETLRWKYADGRGESWLAVSARGDPLLHCGLSFRQLLLAGEPLRAAQLVDLAGGGSGTGLARRDSPFARLMRELLTKLPRADNPDGVAFGFPSGRAMRLGQHLGVYRSVDRLVDLHFATPGRRGAGRVREITVADDGPAVGRLWSAMAKSLADFAIGARDPAHLHHRYAAHPELRYRTLLVESRWWRKPFGLAVLRDGAECTTLLDLIGRPDDMPEMLAALVAAVPVSPQKPLLLSITQRFADRLAPLADRRDETQFEIMANPFSPAKTTEQLAGRWWLTGGDTDYR